MSSSVRKHVDKLCMCLEKIAVDYLKHCFAVIPKQNFIQWLVIAAHILLSCLSLTVILWGILLCLNMACFKQLYLGSQWIVYTKENLFCLPSSSTDLCTDFQEQWFCIQHYVDLSNYDFMQHYQHYVYPPPKSKWLIESIHVYFTSIGQENFAF